jgi:putative FmdB family regulatory protein
MPLYEYECSKCGGVLETLQKLSDPPLTIHENCGGELKRLVSTSALHFKGTGWYVTDYAKGNKSNAPTPKAESKDRADGKDKAEVKDVKSDAPKPAAESKPAPAKT